jgi:hypothetical protein
VSEQGFFTILFLSASLAEQAFEAACAPFRRLIAITSRQQQTQSTLLDWLRVESGIQKPSNKPLSVTIGSLANY